MLDSHVFQIPRGAVESRIDVYWSPDARRIAWFFSGKVASGDEGETVPFDELVIDRAVGPRIEITGEKGLGPEALDRVADAIETAGFAPTGQRVAKAGAKTIVYAVKRWSAQASQIASAVPGGAEVKALAAPKGGFEVVVALGRTAAAAMKR